MPQHMLQLIPLYVHDQVEARQKILEAIEKEESKEKRSKMNEDAPRELHGMYRL